MMLKIFRDKKEPLLGRATAEIRLQPFSTELFSFPINNLISSSYGLSVPLIPRAHRDLKNLSHTA